MSDNDMLRRGDVLKAVDMWESDWPCTYSAILALPAVQPDALTADNARLRAALETCLETMGRADFADGWCCCGDDMLKHSSPMDCGHTPVDMGEYHASLAIKNARAAINPGKEVMPDERPVRFRSSDIGPGDQAVAGAANDTALYGTGFMLDGEHVPHEDVYAQPEPVAGVAPVMVPTEYERKVAQLKKDFPNGI